MPNQMRTEANMAAAVRNGLEKKTIISKMSYRGWEELSVLKISVYWVFLLNLCLPPTVRKTDMAV